jgi:hypothetical protein
MSDPDRLTSDHKILGPNMGDLTGALPRPRRSLDGLPNRYFEARARQITGGPAVELILGAIGGDSLRKGHRLLAPTGRPPTRPGMVGMWSILASAPWLQFNPLSLMNTSKGVFGVNWGIPAYP